MPEVSIYLQALIKILKKTELKNLIMIVSALLCMSGSKTMLNISRWTKISHKTIERFYNSIIPWLDINIIILIMLKTLNPKELILAGDETTVTKSGKKTYGLDYFFNSIYQKTMKSLCFVGISLIDVEKNRAYPLMMKQLVFTSVEKENLQKQKEQRKKSKGGKRGRKKGTKNSPKAKELPPTFRLLKDQICDVLSKLNGKVPIKYFVGDGGYGNSTCANICKGASIFLVSKLQYNAALYLPYNGSYSGRGRKRVYGDKINYVNLPKKYVCKTEFDEKEGIQSIIYQFQCLNKEFYKEFKQKLNVVIIRKINFKTNKESHIVLFSTDLELSFQKIIQFYSSRFQIEFNFRDAKEFWGLEDFMNVNELPIHNAANLAFSMVNVSNILLSDFRNQQQNQNLGIRDLIAGYRANKYIFETLKLVAKFNPNFLFPDDYAIINSIGRIHV